MRVDLSTLPESIQEKVEYRDWMTEDTDYVAYKGRGPMSYGGSKASPGSRHEIKLYVRAYKLQHGCNVCGEREPRCLHFHHRDPKAKKFTISMAKYQTLAQVKEEISKCDLLCGNCHAKVHSRRLVRLDEFLKRQKLD